ncbi:LON peptidase substrate-binding domain-containing protein [Vibrio profundi]|uniref:LON peptidase substrate-binding domain-containing protein n=1 Tax=Vibrio profundi TaxID=1774960 RepID=UPI003736FFB6
MTELILFPLNSVVLPKGRMTLRIFEPRYQRMVKLCCSEDIGFGICLVCGRSSDHLNQFSEIGTMVKIVDFELLDNGILGITVEGTQKFIVKKVWKEFDGLRKASVEYLDNWPESTFDSDDRYLSNQLKEVYKHFPKLGDLYAQQKYDDASWVTQRWLELLPLDLEQFEQLTLSKDCEQAKNFLRNAIEPLTKREKGQ